MRNPQSVPKRLQPGKVSVEFRTGMGPRDPVEGRHYTLTHSDSTGELFLTVAFEYAWDKTTELRDEVLLEWEKRDEQWRLSGKVTVATQEMDKNETAFRERIFRQELPLALEAVRYGDREFFAAHPYLDLAQIYMRFDAPDPEFHCYEVWGSPRDYE